MSSTTSVQRSSLSGANWRKPLAPRNAGVVYALVLLVAILTFTCSVQGRPSYLSSVNVTNILDQSALIATLAIFMTVVLITGNFDLSVASTAALAGTIALKLIDGYGVAVAVLVALAVGGLVGLVNGVLVQKVGVNAFIVTLGTLTAVRGIVQAILDGQSITAANTALNSFATAHWAMPMWLAGAIGIAAIAGAAYIVVRSPERGRSILSTGALWSGGIILLLVALVRPNLLNVTVPVWIMIVLAILTSLVMKYTVLGRNLYAVGGNSEAARLSGIDVDRYKMGAFIVNGVVAALVGILYAGRFNSVDPTVLTGGELTVIAAAVLGGTSLFGGSGVVAKSVVGALILFTLSNGFNVLNIGANYQNVVQGGVLVAAAALYTATSQGERRQLRSRFRGRSGGAVSPGGSADGALPVAPSGG